MKKFSPVIVSLLFAVSSFATVKLPVLVSDSMVLQRDTKLKIWGWAAAGEKVTVQFTGKTFSTVTGTNGKWQVELPAMKAGGPYDMQIDGSNHITLKNILIGDVWLCSGQSNMVIPMERVKEKYADIIAHINNPSIRHFFIATKYNFYGPEEDLPPGKWETATPANILRFTAAGYFFANAIYEKYHVPIGLINASVGGTPAESWISKESLKDFPNHLATVEKYKDSLFVDSTQKYARSVTMQWNGTLQQQDKGLNEGKKWFDSTYTADDWQTMNIPGFWNDQGLKGVHGAVWFRKEINVPASMIGKPAKLWMGRIVDADYAYVNGVFVGTISYQYPPRRYELPAGLLKPGKNVIVVRVINSGGLGGFIVDKTYALVAGDQTIDLKGEWKYKVGTPMPPMRPAGITFQNGPVGLFNSMIAPLLPYAIKGALWYQGEANTGRAREYQKLMPILINDWRRQWGEGDFPFLIVQLPNFMPVKNLPSESQWAELRESQLKTLSVPNTALAVTIDIGEWNDLHPLDKKDVGERLALAARKLAYNEKKIEYSGPLYQSMTTNGNKVTLSFTHTGKGLIAKNGSLKCFAIAGADKKFVWANATIEGDKVILWSDAVTSPVAVRYAWADNPGDGLLYNKEGLPASPFRTDN